MFKTAIILITLGAIFLSCFIINSIPSTKVDSEVLKIQLYFLLSSEAVFGIILSGLSCSGKGTFEPYHIGQICISGIYALLELGFVGFAFSNIGKVQFLNLNLAVSFITLSVLILLGVANFNSSRNANKNLIRANGKKSDLAVIDDRKADDKD